MTTSEVDERFNNLKGYKFNLVRMPYFIRNINGNWYNSKSLKYSNLILKNDPEDYLKYNLICDYWSDPLRMTYLRYDRQKTPKQYWDENKEHVRQQSLYKYGADDAYSLRETIYELAGECTEFRPTVLVSLIKMFRAKRVLDPAAGSGSRLIAAIALGVDYTGVDPNSSAHDVYNEIIQYFSPKSATLMIKSPFEDCELPEGKTYDLIMTSPPYFSLEKYSGEETQSIMRYPLLEDWFNNFLMATLNKAWNVLEIGGNMCININDIFKGASYCKRMVDTFNSNHLDAKFLGVVSYSEIVKERAKSPQPIFCWTKICL